MLAPAAMYAAKEYDSVTSGNDSRAVPPEIVSDPLTPVFDGVATAVKPQKACAFEIVDMPPR
jgi:hypothetical protein